LLTQNASVEHEEILNKSNFTSCEDRCQFCLEKEEHDDPGCPEDCCVEKRSGEPVVPRPVEYQPLLYVDGMIEAEKVSKRLTAAGETWRTERIVEGSWNQLMG
jgi:hypothetical protein